MGTQHIYRITFAGWVFATLAHCSVHLWPFIFGNLPPVPPGEVYFANDVAFQLLVFAYFYLPWWLVGLVVVLLLEFAFFRYRAQPGHAVASGTDAP